MTRTLPVFLGALALVAVPMVADARGMGQGRAMLPGFEALDSDGSGAVTLEDFQAAISNPQALARDQLVARLMQEADADGKLDEAALRAGLEAHSNERREARRTQMQTRMFERIDTDGDGVISAEEYEAFTTRMSERMERRGAREGRPMQRRNMR